MSSTGSSFFCSSSTGFFFLAVFSFSVILALSTFGLLGVSVLVTG